VPHEENISYFGSPLHTPASELPARGDEAQLVYQFPLAPLVLHSLQTGNGTALSDWASSLEKPFPQAMFFNFLASHDGIGVRPAEGLLSGAEIHALVQHTLEHGGRVSYRNNPDGSQSAYELNITLYDALNDPSRPDPEMDFLRFLASQVIMLSLAGVPGIYFHSLIASRNCQECVEQTGRARSINRQKFQLEELESRLSNPHDPAARTLSAYTQLLETRAEHAAFHPLAEQRVLHLDHRLFTVVRTASDSSETVLCMVNLSDENFQIEVELERWQLPLTNNWQDLLGSDHLPARENKLPVQLAPYQSTWLRTGV
jgi:sucrose phosphorylase